MAEDLRRGLPGLYFKLRRLSVYSTGAGAATEHCEMRRYKFLGVKAANRAGVWRSDLLRRLDRD